MDIHTPSSRSRREIELAKELTTEAANKQMEAVSTQLPLPDPEAGMNKDTEVADDRVNIQQCMEMNMVMDSDNNNTSSEESLMAPLVQPPSDIRSRKKITGDDDENYDLGNSIDDAIDGNLGSNLSSSPTSARRKLRKCCDQVSEIQNNLLRNTITFMSFMARILFWASLVVLTGAVVYYSKELYFHGTEAHLVAWFSAGAFVILGFPISIYGILMHLANYYQPNIQCYVVRILWMVPIYSIESWLCLRFHEFAIYIETLRDVYESFVLYCFLQFLIEVLGGEEALIILLKDKSPTRGVHLSPMHWCLKPWVMGQPVSRTSGREGRGAQTTTSALAGGERTVRWTSPFFVQCKFGCLQYVLLKFVSSIVVCGLEVYGLYKEGDFTIRGGYLYIAFLTNLSQCWALYCLVIFYYATKNELSPIRPVGKFLSVKALVFFTWWQSLGISILSQLNLIPSYIPENMTAEDVAKGLQAWLICIEMFIGAIVHMFVFPHTDYLKPTIISTTSISSSAGTRRLGRHGLRNWNDDRSMGSKKSSASVERYEFADTQDQVSKSLESPKSGHPPSISNSTETSARHLDPNNKPPAKEQQQKTRFARALIDSFVPIDVMNNTVGIARGDFTVEKKTLLYHAAASDQYSLFAKRKAMQVRKDDSTEVSSKSSTG